MTGTEIQFANFDPADRRNDHIKGCLPGLIYGRGYWTDHWSGQ